MKNVKLKIKKWLMNKLFKEEMKEIEKTIIAKDTQIKNLKTRINLLTLTKGL